MTKQELLEQIEILEQQLQSEGYFAQIEARARELLLESELDLKLEIRVQQLLYGSLLEQSRFQEALVVAEQVLNSIDNDAENEVDNEIIILKGRTLANIGLISYNLSDAEKAFECLHQAMPLFESVDNKLGIARTQNTLGIVYTSIADYSAAKEVLLKAHEFFVHENMSREQAFANFNFAQLHFMRGDYAQALEYLDACKSLLTASNDKRLLARCYVTYANVYSALSEYENAFECLGKAAELLEQSQDHEYAKLLNSTGMMYFEIADYARALDCYLQSLQYVDSSGNSGVRISNLGNIGMLYGILGDHTQALQYILQSISVAEKFGLRDAYGIGLGNLGVLCHEQLQDYSKAEESMLKGLEILSELGNKRGAAPIYESLAALYSNTAFTNHDFDKAEEYCKRALALNDEIGRRDTDSVERMMKILSAQHRWEEAFQFQQLYYTMREEIRSSEASRVVAQLEQKKLIAEREKQAALAKATAEAELNATRSLLDSVLPSSIADRMISGEERIADFYADVSILFADIVGFTSLTTELPPGIVIEFLNHVFDIYDTIMKRHGCEKIKTIGDGYMAIAGAPETCEDHAERIARAALEMQEDIVLPESIRQHLPSQAEFHIRIGIHCGPVVCGVVAKERFVWDVYSDAVNTASRMEANGVPSKIHVSEEFAQALRNRQELRGLNEFILQERGDIDVKGKGMMKTFFLESV